MVRLRAHRAADPKLLSALRHQLREHAVQPDRGEQQRTNGEKREDRGAESRKCQRLR